MTLKVFRSAVAKLCGPLHIAKSGVWKPIVRIRIWKTYGNPPLQGWRDLYVVGSPPAPPPPAPPPPPPPPPVQLTVTVAPTEVSGTRVGRGTVYTNVAQATVSGGTAPYTYTWSRVSYSGSTIPGIYANVDPSKTQFSRDMQGALPEHQTARFKCFAQDSLGNTGQGYVDADFYTSQRDTGDWTNSGGGGSIP